SSASSCSSSNKTGISHNSRVAGEESLMESVTRETRLRPGKAGPVLAAFAARAGGPEGGRFLLGNGHAAFGLFAEPPVERVVLARCLDLGGIDGHFGFGLGFVERQDRAHIEDET